MGLTAACAPAVPNARALHYVEGELVYSRPPPPQAYEAYMHARLALDADPPQPEVALEYLQIALRADSKDPHLWATRAEAEAMVGDVDGARASANKALAIAPGYPKAQRVLASLEGGARVASVPTADDNQ